MNENTSLNQGLTQTTTIESKDKVDAEDIQSGLGSMEGVRNVEVSGKTVSVTYDPTMIDENAIREAVANGGVAPLAGGGTAGSDTGGTDTDVAPIAWGEANPQ